MSEEVPSQGPMMTPEGSAKRAIAKKIVIGGLIGATTVGVILLIIILLGNNRSADNRYDSGVVIRVDNEEKQSHFKLVGQTGVEPNSDGVLIGEPLGTTYLATAPEVKSYYDEKVAALGPGEKLGGAFNLEHKALFYTVHLENTSQTDAQTFRVVCELNDKLSDLASVKGARAYEFLRLGLRMGVDGEADDDVRYFGLASSSQYRGEKDDPNDKRECISAFTTRYVVDQETKTGYYYRDPTYLDGSLGAGHEIGYAEAFQTGSDGIGLFDVDGIEIPAGKIYRVTFFAYLEGEDPDSYKETPGDQSLSFSLHIGV